MSSLTDGFPPLRAAARPTGLIVAVAILEALKYALAHYWKSSGRDGMVPWMLLDAYLIRKVWFGSFTAWNWLVVLNVGSLALCAMTLTASNTHVDGGPLVVVRLCLEIALLAAPSMRRWVNQD